MHRAATILGLGLNQVKYVPVDSKYAFQTQLSALIKKIKYYKKEEN